MNWKRPPEYWQWYRPIHWGNPSSYPWEKKKQKNNRLTLQACKHFHFAYYDSEKSWISKSEKSRVEFLRDLLLHLYQEVRVPPSSVADSLGGYVTQSKQVEAIHFSFYFLFRFRVKQARFYIIFVLFLSCFKINTVSNRSNEHSYVYTEYKKSPKVQEHGHQISSKDQQ